MVKTIRQIFIIVIFSSVTGLLVNWVSPKGIPLVMDMSKYSTGKSDSLKNEFINNPTDTSVKQEILANKRKPNKQGFIEPQNIKLDFAKLLYDKNALFIDGRKAIDYEEGHVKNAINISYEEFHKKDSLERVEIMKKYNKDGIIVCYCKGGDCELSIDLAYDLARLGFTSVNIYLGGYKEWETAGHPVERK